MYGTQWAKSTSTVAVLAIIIITIIIILLLLLLLGSIAVYAIIDKMNVE